MLSDVRCAPRISGHTIDVASSKGNSEGLKSFSCIAMCYDIPLPMNVSSLERSLLETKMCFNVPMNHFFGMFVMFACQGMRSSHLHLLSSVASTKSACQLWTGTKRSTTSSRPFLQRPTGTSRMSLKGFRRCVIRLLSGRASNSITSGISFYWKFLNSLESCLFHWFSTLCFMLYIPQMLRRALHS